MMGEQELFADIQDIKVEVTKKEDEEKIKALKPIITKSVIVSLFKECGVNRVTSDAKITFSEMLHAFAFTLIERAIEHRDRAQRKTLYDVDLENAMKELFQ